VNRGFLKFHDVRFETRPTFKQLAKATHRRRAPRESAQKLLLSLLDIVSEIKADMNVKLREH
jgi:hypothetical protein